MAGCAIVAAIACCWACSFAAAEVAMLELRSESLRFCALCCRAAARSGDLGDWVALSSSIVGASCPVWWACVSVWQYSAVWEIPLESSHPRQQVLWCSAAALPQYMHLGLGTWMGGRRVGRDTLDCGCMGWSAEVSAWVVGSGDTWGLTRIACSCNCSVEGEEPRAHCRSVLVLVGMSRSFGGGFW